MTLSNTSERIRNILGPPILFALSSLLWAIPLILNQFAWVADLQIHYQWAAQFEQAIREGVWVPRWAALSHNGLGDATFLHIHPLFYYLVAGINTLVSDLWLSMKLIVILSHLLLTLGVFRLVNRRFGQKAGLLSGLSIQWMPYHFFLINYSQALPTLLAIALTAIALDLAFRDRSDPKWVSLVALSLCGVVIAHILVAFTLLLTLTLAIAVSTFLRNKDGKRCFSLLTFWSFAALLGLGISSWYWIPAVLGRHMINPQGWELGQWLSPQLEWGRNFIFPIVTAITQGSTSVAILWLAPLPLFLIALFAFQSMLSRTGKYTESNQKLINILTFACLISLFLSSGLSWPLWKITPALQQLQFPWRFLAISGIAASILLGWMFTSSGPALASKYIGISFLLLCFSLTLLLAGQAFYSGKSVLPSESWLDGEFGQPEYLPAWVPYSKTNPNRTENYLCRSENKKCMSIHKGTHSREYRVVTDNAVSLELPIHFHPGWQVTIDGEQTPLAPSQARGLVEAKLPPGVHTVEIHWKGTIFESVGRFLSLFSILLGIALPIIFKRNSWFKRYIASQHKNLK